MKKLFTIFCFFVFIASFSHKTAAQSYTLQTLSSAYQNLSSPIALHTNDSISWWDDAIGSFTIPFTFILFGDTVPTLYFYDAYLTDDTTSESYEINVFGANIWGNSSPVSYQITGSAPNRIYKVEWTDIGFDNYADVSSANIQFQLWLYETTNVIEIRFGNSYVPDAATAYDGLTGPQINLGYFNMTPYYFLVLQGNPSSPTTTIDTNVVLTGTPPLNTVYRFTPFTSSIKQNAFQNEISFYPNPATDNITLTSPLILSEATVLVYNIQGALLYQQNLQSGNMNIDLSGLAKGVYILKLTGKDINVVKPIIKQ